MGLQARTAGRYGSGSGNRFCSVLDFRLAVYIMNSAAQVRFCGSTRPQVRSGSKIVNGTHFSLCFRSSFHIQLRQSNFEYILPWLKEMRLPQLFLRVFASQATAVSRRATSPWSLSALGKNGNFVCLKLFMSSTFWRSLLHVPLVSQVVDEVCCYRATPILLRSALCIGHAPGQPSQHLNPERLPNNRRWLLFRSWRMPLTFSLSRCHFVWQM